MSIKYNDNGTFKDIKVKVGDNIPVGAEFDYDGNTIPVGYEEVDNPNNYSTTEQVIGTWIDGKPIYRKVITITNSQITGQSTNIAHGISNLGEIIYQTITWKRNYTNDQGRRLFPGIWYGSLDWACQLVTDDTNMNLQMGNSIYGAMSNQLDYAYAILEYTKTTD